MGQSVHIGVLEFLVAVVGCVFGRWMRFRPRDVLVLMNLGSETGHRWLLMAVSGLGMMTFFGCVNILIMGITPDSLQSTPGSSLIWLAAAIALSVAVLKRKKKAASELGSAQAR